MEQVSQRVYVDAKAGPCTVGAVRTDAGVVLVDSPNPPSRAIEWAKQVEALGPVRYLINTEHHADHVFCNPFLPGIILSHQHVKDRFWEDDELGPNFQKNPESFVRIFEPGALHLVEGYKAREPEITFRGDLTLYVGGVEIRLLPRHGHVPFDTAVYIPQERVLFPGDNVFNNVMTWYHASLPFEWLDSLAFFQTLDVDIVVPGHGRPAGPEVLGEMRSIVQDAIETVRNGIDAGMNREKAVERLSFLERQPVPPEFASMAPNLQKLFVGRVHDQVLTRRG